MIADFAGQSGFSLRKFSAKDIVDFVELGSPTCAFMHGRPGMTEQAMEKNFSAFVKDYAFEADSEIFVLETPESKIIGQLWLHFTSNRFNGLKECWVWDLTIHKDHQRKGLGKELMKFAKERAISHSCKELWLLVSSRNNNAIAMYESQGLTDSGHLMSVLL
jgi:ribosomal protein S18 acetylase RimI-like enzyme